MSAFSFFTDFRLSKALCLVLSEQAFCVLEPVLLGYETGYEVFSVQLYHNRIIALIGYRLAGKNCRS